jgi:hypothetical protein
LTSWESGSLAVADNHNGTFNFLPNPGDTVPQLGPVTIGGSLTSTGMLNVGGDLTTMTVGRDLDGTVIASGTVQSLSVGESVGPTASITVGNLDTFTVGPDSLVVGDNFAGTLTVAGTLGSMRVAGGTPGSVIAGHVGTIAVHGGYGPVVLRVIENGIERRVELASPDNPYPQPDPNALATSAYVNVQFFYESGTLANPQLTARISNGVGTAPSQYDLSLVTYNDAAKFNLARLNAIGVAGVRNVAVEGDVLSAVSSQASAFFTVAGPDSTFTVDATPAGIRLPLDHLAGVGVRDFLPNRSIQAASIQAVAFGSYTRKNGRIRTGAAAKGKDAGALLVRGTKIVAAKDTYRVPFAGLLTQQVTLFVATDKPGGHFDSNGITLKVQGVSSPNAEGTANIVTPSNTDRGAVIALVTATPTFDRQGHRHDSFVRSIDLRGDGGSIQTKQMIAGPITSTGPLGNLILQSKQGVGDVTAPSIFGSIVVNGPITGVVQTTGQRTDPITASVSSVSADLGLLYVVTNRRRPVVTSTVVQSKGISGTLISRGDLVSKITVKGGGFTGVVAAQGNLGKTFLASSGQETRLGGLTSNAVLSGEVVVLGSILGDVTINRGLKDGQIAARDGIVGNITVRANARIIHPNPRQPIAGAWPGADARSAIVSGGAIGDGTLGTRLVFNGSNHGIIAAVGLINVARKIPNGSVYNNLGSNPDDQSLAAIDAIFTQEGNPLALDISGFDLGGLALIQQDLKVLNVDSNKKLTGTTA